MRGKEKAPRVSQNPPVLPAREDAGGDLAVPFCEVAGGFYRSGAIFCGERGGRGSESLQATIFLFAGQRKEFGIFREAVRERSRILQSDKYGIFFEAIGGHAGGAAVDNGANRDGDAVFGHVLVN